MSRRPQLTDRGDGGFTVPELAVTMLLLSIVILVILNFLDSASTITSRSASNVQAERDGQLALRQVTQDVRASRNLRACTSGTYAQCLRFDVLRPSDAQPDCVSTYSYRIGAGVVSQDRADANCGSSGVTWTGREVIKVSNTALFNYFDRLGREIVVTSACSADPNQPVCVPFAKTVRVSISVPFPGRPAGSLSLSSTAALRNNR